MVGPLIDEIANYETYKRWLGNQPLACWIARRTGDLAGFFGQNSSDGRLPKSSRPDVSLDNKRHTR